ncbi:MAG: ribosomal-processing cysteine protease Prp [Clostridiales bacterium]|jgi:uncharacterized protein YsxB (DUF464 family)|nr:ribosomal-processing cysteine protease Prp [Clostridiales bacterium]
MISAEFAINREGDLIGFQIRGHANGEAGEDIVCAAVSSAAYMTANTITEVAGVDASVAVDEDGEMYLRIPRRDIAVCRDLLAGFKLHMLALEEQYPQDIQVNYTEV